MSHLSWTSVANHLSSKKPLFSKWRSSQETTTGHKAEINRLWGTQTQWIHPHYSSCHLWLKELHGYQDASCETLCPRNGCKNKTGTISVSVDMLMWQGGCLLGLTPRQTTSDNWWLLGEKELASPKDESPCSMQSGQPWSHIYTPTTEQTQ